jgi:hypothetical protein
MCCTRRGVGRPRCPVSLAISLCVYDFAAVLTATPCAPRSGASIASIKDSARVTVDALGRAEKANALTERYGRPA